MSRICRENAFIFRITHVDNVPWLLQNGLHCGASANRDPNFHEIGNPDLIAKRARRVVPIAPGGTLSDYIPFYFTPCSPMLYNIKTGHNGMRKTPMTKIAILVSSLHRIAELKLAFVFTDRHAYLQTAEFKTNLRDLSIIDWKMLAARDFRRDPNQPEKIERYQAEALIYRRMPTAALVGIGCYDGESESRILGMQEASGVFLKTAVKREWYLE